MPAPQAIVCHLCNGKYFKRSWPIHLKQCEAKWKKTHSRCEYCGAAVAKDDWSDHRVHCKPDRKKKLAAYTRNMPLVCPKAVDNESLSALMSTAVIECEECETEQAMWQCVQCEQKLCAMCDVELHKKGARARHRRNPLNAKALRAENLANTDADGNLMAPTFEPEKDQRAECKFCGRRFNPDRVEKHMRICSKAEAKWQKRKPYDGAKKRIEGTEFKQFEYNRSSTPEKVKEWRKYGRRWKEESAMLRGAAGVPELDLEQKTTEVRSLKIAKKALATEEEFLKAREDPKRVFKKALETRVSLLPKPRKKTSPPSSGRSNSSGNSAKDSAVSSTKSSAKSSARSTGRKSSVRSTGRKSSALSSAGSSIVGGAIASSVARNRRPIKSMKEPAKVRGQRARSTNDTNSDGSSFSSRSSARSFGSRSSRSSRISARSKKAVNPNEVNLSTTGSSVRGSQRAKKPGVPKFQRRKSTSTTERESRVRGPKKGGSVEPKSNKRKTAKERDAENMAMAIQRSFEQDQTGKDSSLKEPAKARGQRARASNDTNSDGSSFGSRSSAQVSKAPKTNVRKAALVQKENDSRTQQQSVTRVSKKIKSAAGALPRGIELGVNVKKAKEGDAPKDMSDYMERERARRAQRSKGAKGSKSSTRAPRPKAVAYEAPKKKARKDAEAPTKLMSRMQIRQESNAPIGSAGNRINKPAGSKDFASKRAAYFETLLRNQE